MKTLGMRRIYASICALMIAVALLTGACSAVLPVYTLGGPPAPAEAYFIHATGGGRRMALSWSDDANLVFLRPVSDLASLCADSVSASGAETGSAFALQVQDWAAGGATYAERRAQAAYLSRREYLAADCPSISNRISNFTCVPAAVFRARSSNITSPPAYDDALILSTKDAWYPISLYSPVRDADGRPATPPPAQVWWLSVRTVGRGSAEFKWVYTHQGEQDLRQVLADAERAVPVAAPFNASAAGAEWRMERRSAVCG